MTPRMFAEALVQALGPSCERISIAGSVRRERPDPHDLELVVSPVRALDLYGEPTDATPEFDTALQALLDQGLLQRDALTKRWGPKLKRCVAPKLGGMPVELYIADRDNFGALLLIRTGDADFSHRLVLPRRHGGLMPNNLRQWEGYLCRLDDDGGIRERIPTPTELAYFTQLGIREVPEPRYRDKQMAYRLRSRP